MASEEDDGCSWVQVIEPKSKEYLYVNLGTGECLWEAPATVSFKKSDNSEWWELFDKKTGRFYYYSTHLQTTVWHRPANCDIIPLAKLQMLKCQSVEENSNKLDVDCLQEEEGGGGGGSSFAKKEISTQTAMQEALNTNETNKSTDDADNEIVLQDSKPLTEHDKSSNESDEPSDERESSATNHGGSNVSEEKRESNLSDELPKLPLRSAQTKAHHQPCRVCCNNVESRQYHPCHWERHSHPEATRYPAHTIQRDFTYPSVPQRSLEFPVSPGIRDGLSDLPRTCVWQQSHECRMLANEFTSSLAQLPTEGFHPPCYLRQESYPGYTHDAGGRCFDASKAPAYKTVSMSRPRAFPRTNPSFVGTYRRERQLQVAIPHGMHNTSGAVGDESRSYAAANGQSPYANFEELASQKCTKMNRGAANSKQINTTFGTISKKQLSLWSGKDSANILSFADPCVLTNFHVHKDVHGVGEGENMLHSHRNQIRFGDHGISLDGQMPCHLGMKVQKRHNNHALSDQLSNDPFAVQLRRRSEPEYVNIPSGHGRMKLGTNNVKPFFSADVEMLVGSLPDNYSDHGRDSHCSDPPCIERVSLDEYGKELSDDSCLHSSRGLSPRNSDGLPDIDCDDSDRISAQSTPSPQTRQFQMIMPSKLQPAVSVSSTYHPSLRKKKWLERTIPQPLARQSTLEKDWLMQTTADVAQQHRPVSMLTVSPSESNVIANKVAGTLLQQLHIEQFVLENLNEHRKGILGKTVSVGHMLSWTKDVIQKPMIRTSNKSVKKEAPEIFKLILMYMGDRKTKDPLASIALDVTIRGWTIVELRDEIFIQLCRQTSKNPRGESAVQGWELLGICLAFFPPSSKFHSFLDDHIHKSIDGQDHNEKSLMYLYMVSCQRRLQWVVQVGAKRGLRKPTTDDVEHAKRSLLEPSMFGSSLEEIMNLQKEHFPDRQLPWIQTTLSEQVLQLNGSQTEGIFRVPGDIDEVNTLKVQCDKWNVPSNLTDPNLPASLLKLWYRELYEPLVPYSFYSQCLDNFANPEGAVSIVSTLPEINRLVFTYLIRFLQEFAKPENATVTKMDVNNLAMVMAPNCLRCLSNDPKVIFENTRREMGFIRTLIQHLDTSCVKDLL